jgi:hypothetical protein
MTVVAAYGTTSKVVNFSVTANDACDGAMTPVSTPASGSTFSVGSTTVTSAATDAAGNTGSCSFKVTVLPAGSALFLVPPCRLIDTRGPTGSYGGPSLAPNNVRNIYTPYQCGIPYGVKALAVNLTAVTPAGSGWLTLFAGPYWSTVPTVSSLNYTIGKTLANNAIVSVGYDSSINVYNSGPSTVNFIVDVTGYFK